jgi:sulfate adenylyltransferase subunit 1 (EFTu-like GTPase family)
MDLVDFSESVFQDIQRTFCAFARQLGARDLHFIPISALEGDNVVTASARTPWYRGPTLLNHLETVPLHHDNHAELRFPVQYVIRPDLDFRGFAGQIASGTLRRGDRVNVLPSGRQSRVKSIVTYDGELEEASSPMSVTVCLEDEIDISRGDMLVPESSSPHVASRFEALAVWMNEKPLEPQRPYLLKHTSQTVRARVADIRYRVDINTLHHEPAPSLQLNEIGLIAVEAQKHLFFDPYRRNRVTGSFILIDPITNETVGAGMITGASGDRTERGRVTPAEREALRGHPAKVVVVPPGYEELAYEIERLLFDRAWLVHVISDPEDLRQAILTSCAAGLISIVLSDDDLEIRASAGEADVVVVDPIAADRPDAARTVLRNLIQRDDGLTGGAGI